jgi:hypothetical protein
VGHARKRVLGELREVHHRDLPVFLLHLGGRAAAGARAARPAGATTRRCGALTRCRSLSIRCGPAAAAGTASCLEQLTQRPRVRGDAIQLVLLAERLGRGLLARRQRHTRGSQAGSSRLQKLASIHSGIILAFRHDLHPHLLLVFDGNAKANRVDPDAGVDLLN